MQMALGVLVVLIFLGLFVAGVLHLMDLRALAFGVAGLIGVYLLNAQEQPALAVVAGVGEIIAIVVYLRLQKRDRVKG